MNSYDVRFWDIKKVGDTARGRWRVRWAVAGRSTAGPSPPGRSPTGSSPASKTPSGARQPFDTGTGLPATGQQQAAGGDVTWYEHARAYTDAKWPHLAPISRRSIAESLTTVTIALVRRPARRPRPRAAAPVPVRLGVQPRHPQPHPAR